MVIWRKENSQFACTFQQSDCRRVRHPKVHFALSTNELVASNCIDSMDSVHSLRWIVHISIMHFM